MGEGTVWLFIGHPHPQTDREIELLVNVFDDGREAVVFHAGFSDLIEKVRPQLPKVKAWVAVAEPGHPVPAWADDYDAIVAKVPAQRPVRAPWGVSGDDLLLLYTGGTTGMPKGVMWRQDDLFQVLGAGGNAALGILPATSIPELLGRIAGPEHLKATMIVAAVALLARTGLESAPGASRRWVVSDVRALTSDPGPERRPHVSPDGSRIAFGITEPGTNIGRIVVRTLDQSRLVRLTADGPGYEWVPVWSPDGTRIAYQTMTNASDCMLHVAVSLGGGVRDIGRCRVYSSTYYDWTPDGRGLLTADHEADDKPNLKLFVLDLDSGAKRYLDYARDPQDQDLEGRYSPDGRRIAFRRGIAPYSDLFMMEADGSSVHALTHLASRIHGFAWTRDGSALVFASDHAGPMALYVVDTTSGDVHALGVSPAEWPDAARTTDTVVYEIPRAHSTLSRASLSGDAPSTPQPLARSTGSDFDPQLSPAGDRVAFVSDRSGQSQVWLQDLASGDAVALTGAVDIATVSPRWSRDGNSLVMIENAAGKRRLVEMDIASRQRRVLSHADENVLEVAAGAAGDVYVWAADVPGEDNRLVRVRHAGSKDEQRDVIARAVSNVDFDSSDATLYFSPRTVGGGVYRVAFDHGVATQVSHEVPMRQGRWRVFGGELWYFSDLTEKVATLNAFDLAAGRDRKVATLHAIVLDTAFSVLPDRQGILIAPSDRDDTDVGMLKLERRAYAD